MDSYSFDKILLEFVGGNWLSITFVLMLLQGVARVSPWKWDEALVNVLAEAFSFLRGKVSRDEENNKE